MHWKKQGLIYCPDGSQDWAQAHAMVPTPWLIDKNRIRLFISSTDSDMVAGTGYLDLDIRDPKQILEYATTPCLSKGEAGCFDDNGVNATSIVESDGKLWMYYFGYQLGVQVRYTLFGGVATSTDAGDNFERSSRAPVIDRSDSEPLLRSAPFVLLEDDLWRMWYVGGEKHIESGDTTRPTYEIRYVESANGTTWPSESVAAVKLSGDGDEYGLGRPYVVKLNDGYRMWYSIRTHSQGYKIGYATSPDGLNWTRRDDVTGLECSDEGWDSEMVCYGAEISTDFGNYLFYNGNDYGRSGVGFAVLEDAG